MNYQTNANYVFDTNNFVEKSDPVSKTRPDQSMSIQKLLQRHNQGRPIEINKNLVYTKDLDYPEVKKMDLVDLKEAADKNRKIMEEARREIKRKETEWRTQQQEAAWLKKAQANKAAEAKANGTTKDSSRFDGVIDPNAKA